MQKFFLYFIVLIGCVLSLFIVTDATIIGIIVGVISSVLLVSIDAVASNSGNFRYWWISLRFRNTYLRLSLSYLFRIQIDDKFLLVKSKRFDYQFQPVGGVYKRYAGSSSFLSKIQTLDDDLIPVDEFSKDDLRIRIKGKYLLAFIKWFKSGHEREVSVWREFYEELIGPEILPQKLFPYIQCQFVKRYENSLRYSTYAKSYELIIADIYELIPTKNQEDFLRELITVNSNYFIWADEDRIHRRGAIPRQKQDVAISEHSHWIL